MSVPTRSHPFPERFGTPRSQRSQPFPLYRGGGTLGTVRGNGKGGRDPGRSQYSASRAAGAHAPFVFGLKVVSARYTPAGCKAEEKLGVLCRVLAVAGNWNPDISRGAEFFAKFHHNRRQDEWQP